MANELLSSPPVITCDAFGTRLSQPRTRPKQARLTTHDFARIGGEILRDARTVQRWYRGDKVTESTRVACERGAGALGYRLPEHAR